MTLEEMIEFREMWNSGSVLSTARYMVLEEKYHSSYSNYKNYDIIARLVDNNVSRDEVMKMTEEERITYVYLFELKTQTHRRRNMSI